MPPDNILVLLFSLKFDAVYFYWQFSRIIDIIRYGLTFLDHAVHADKKVTTVLPKRKHSLHNIMQLKWQPQLDDRVKQLVPVIQQLGNNPCIILNGFVWYRVNVLKKICKCRKFKIAEHRIFAYNVRTSVSVWSGSTVLSGRNAIRARNAHHSQMPLYQVQWRLIAAPPGDRTPNYGRQLCPTHHTAVLRGIFGRNNCIYNDLSPLSVPYWKTDDDRYTVMLAVSFGTAERVPNPAYGPFSPLHRVL